MSVSICWEPESTNSRSFETGGSTEMEALQKAFGKRIVVGDIPTLRGMSIATGNEFYDEVADAIEKYGNINVWGEY